VLLSTDRRVLTNIHDSKSGNTFRQLCDLSGVQAGDITKSLQYLMDKDFIQSIERPEGRVFFITETGTLELTGKREPEEFKCQYCEKIYSCQGWLDKHEFKCKKRPGIVPAYAKRTTEQAYAKTIETEQPVASQSQTVRCNGCGSLHKIKRNYGAELLECPLCLKV